MPSPLQSTAKHTAAAVAAANIALDADYDKNTGHTDCHTVMPAQDTGLAMLMTML